MHEVSEMKSVISFVSRSIVSWHIPGLCHVNMMSELR